MASSETTEESRVPVVPEATEVAAAPKGGAAKAAKAKAARALPTDRIALPKQVELLRAYGELSNGGSAVTSAAVAEVVDLHPSTCGLANPFFNDIGLLQRSAEGQIPSADVVAFAKAYQWNAETAVTKLAPPLAASWFGAALIPKLRFRPYTRQDTLAVLAEAAGASASHKGQLDSILELLSIVGVVQIDGDTVRYVRREEEPPATRQDVAPDRGTKHNPPPAPETPGAGKLSFQVGMSVSMAEIALLPADKISAFFTGVAEVMKIQAEIEANRKK